jgi:dCTP deaminase
MILNHQQIAKAVQDGEIKIEPIDQTCIEPASYDLHMGKQAITTTSKEIIRVDQKGFFVINPGEFAIVITNEIIGLNDCHTGRFGLKSEHARKGLIATVGPQIDPGYQGRLIVGLTNLSPNHISISYGEKLFTVEFHRLQQKAEKMYSGKYQGRTELTGEESKSIIDGNCMTLSEMSATLRNLVLTVQSLGEKVSTLTTVMYIFIPILSVLVAIVGIVTTIAALK